MRRCPSRSILIVEDEPLIAMMLEDFLESLGHSGRGTAIRSMGA
jgi:CheY-like chemotaxis protein